MKPKIKNRFARMQALAAAILCFVFFVAAGCGTEKQKAVEFCSLVSMENIGKTIPIVNKVLSDMDSDWDDEQKLQELIDWLNEQPCIIEADVLCQSCMETDPPMSQILISFDENGMTKEFILDVLMTNPLKAAGYREYEISEITHNNVVLYGCDRIKKSSFFDNYYIRFSAIDSKTLQVEQGLELNCCIDSATVNVLSDKNNISINVQEFPDYGPCNCSCPMKVSYNITGLQENFIYSFIFKIGNFEYYTTCIIFTPDLNQTFHQTFNP